MNKRNGREARDIRRNDAAIRQAERDGKTDEQQLKKLIANGHSHCREAMRLRHNIAAAKGVKDE